MKPQIIRNGKPVKAIVTAATGEQKECYTVDELSEFVEKNPSCQWEFLEIGGDHGCKGLE